MSIKNELNIVIPMAGAGSRFQIAGYEEPKPFITYNSKMMIEHVLEGFIKLNAKITIIVQEKFLINQQFELKQLVEKYHVNIITVPKLTMGAVCTCMAAHNVINNELPVLFADSDTIFNSQTIIDFLCDAQNRNLDSSLLTFHSTLQCFSYALIDKDGWLLETKEKEVISNNAICGVYYYKRGKDFINCAIDLIVAQDTQKGEFYMSNTYNYMCRNGKKSGIFKISENNFNCVGTPQQLEVYLKEMSV